MSNRKIARSVATVLAVGSLGSVMFAFTGIIKVLGTGTARTNAAHLGTSLSSTASSVSLNSPLYSVCWPGSPSSLLPS
jgi:hypothetical protein